jgi:hypothetical protein
MKHAEAERLVHLQRGATGNSAGLVVATDVDSILEQALRLPEGIVHCGNCLTPLSPLDITLAGFCCPLCDAELCMLCGCTTDEPCPEGCAWLRPGICSAHIDWLKKEVERVFGDAS